MQIFVFMPKILKIREQTLVHSEMQIKWRLVPLIQAAKNKEGQSFWIYVFIFSSLMQIAIELWWHENNDVLVNVMTPAA